MAALQHVVHADDRQGQGRDAEGVVPDMVVMPDMAGLEQEDRHA